MKKVFVLSFISFTQVFGAAQSSMGTQPTGFPTDLELARANQLSYQLEKTGFERDVVLGLTASCGLPGYTIWDSETMRPEEHPEDIGFQVVTLVNESTKNIIITFRGTATDKVGNLLQDLAIIGAQLTHKNPVAVLAERLDAFLKFYYPNSYEVIASYLIKPYLQNPTQATGSEAYVAHGPVLRELLKAFGYNDVAEAPDKSIAFLHQAIKQASAHVTKTEKIFNAKAIEGKSMAGKAFSYVGALFAAEPKDKMLAGYNVTITGHSLGGFISQIIGAKTGYRTVTFNGPGARAFFDAYSDEIGVKRQDIRPVFNNIRNLIRKDDVVGNFGEHLGSKGLFQNWVPGYTLALQKEYEDYAKAFYWTTPDSLEKWAREKQVKLQELHEQQEPLVQSVQEASSSIEPAAVDVGWWQYACSLPGSAVSTLGTTLSTASTAIYGCLVNAQAEVKKQVTEIAAYILANHSIKNFADDMSIVEQAQGRVSEASNAECEVQSQ